MLGTHSSPHTAHICGSFSDQDCHGQCCFVQAPSVQAQGGQAVLVSWWLKSLHLCNYVYNYVFLLISLCLLLMFSTFITLNKAFSGY